MGQVRAGAELNWFNLCHNTGQTFPSISLTTYPASMLDQN